MNDQVTRNAGHVIPPPPPTQGPGEPTGGLIPDKNGPAQAAYHLGVFSLIPLIGMVLGLAALVLGLEGLRVAARRPEVNGRVHAWIGIIVGGFFGVGYLSLTVLIIADIVYGAY